MIFVVCLALSMFKNDQKRRDSSPSSTPLLGCVHLTKGWLAETITLALQLLHSLLCYNLFFSSSFFPFFSFVLVRSPTAICISPPLLLWGLCTMSWFRGFCVDLCPKNGFSFSSLLSTYSLSFPYPQFSRHTIPCPDQRRATLLCNGHSHPFINHAATACSCFAQSRAKTNESKPYF